MHKITKKQIDEIVAAAKHQQDLVAGVYKLVFPQWDNIKKIGGWPTCSDAMYKHMSRKCQDFDLEHHPDVFAGGLWMNNGFSTLNNGQIVDDDRETFTVDTDECELTME